MGDRLILHSDINCCYASIEHLHHPELAGKPLAVGGDPEARHGIVLTADYIAKKYGVKTGMALWQAKEVCPEIARHVSTQANNTNYATYQFWWELGAKRVVSARELSLEEIRDY